MEKLNKHRKELKVGTTEQWECLKYSGTLTPVGLREFFVEQHRHFVTGTFVEEVESLKDWTRCKELSPKEFKGVKEIKSVIHNQ